jgi:hypothetical protein
MTNHVAVIPDYPVPASGMSIWRAWLAGLAALCVSHGVAAQETRVFEVVKDNTLIEDPGGALSNGKGPVFVGRTRQPTNSIRRGLIAFSFDPATVPRGATVTSVELTLHVTQVADGGAERPVTLHRVLKDWGEGTSSTGGGRGAPATPGDATWIDAFFDTVDWANPGGDFTIEASAQTFVGAEGTYLWSSSPENRLIADVQGWLDDPAGNFGWLIRGNEQIAPTVKVIGSREAGDASLRPALAITFAPAQAASASGVIEVDAGPGVKWIAQGQEGNPQTKVSAGDVLLFRLAEPVPHGLESDDASRIRRCDESPTQKPDAVLEEVPICGSGQSRIGQSIPPLTPGEPPKVFAVLRVLAGLTAPVEFHCVVHPFMTGTIVPAG